MALLTARNHEQVLPPLSAGASLCPKNVIDSGGEVVGTLVDVLLDLERGCIAYAVVASGGFIGLGERLFAVPWSALRAADANMVLEESRGVLESGPAFDKENWPLALAQSWHERVHAHFHSRPYWEAIRSDAAEARPQSLP